MSYGHPCRSTTAGPLPGPASAYPKFSGPASICLNEPNEVRVPGLIGDDAAVALADCAFAKAITPSWAEATVTAAVPTSWRRSRLTSSDIVHLEPLVTVTTRVIAG